MQSRSIQFDRVQFLCAYEKLTSKLIKLANYVKTDYIASCLIMSKTDIREMTNVKWHFVYRKVFLAGYAPRINELPTSANSFFLSLSLSYDRPDRASLQFSARIGRDANLPIQGEIFAFKTLHLFRSKFDRHDCFIFCPLYKCFQAVHSNIISSRLKVHSENLRNYHFKIWQPCRHSPKKNFLHQSSRLSVCLGFCQYVLWVCVCVPVCMWRIALSYTFMCGMPNLLLPGCTYLLCTPSLPPSTSLLFISFSLSLSPDRFIPHIYLCAVLRGCRI